MSSNMSVITVRVKAEVKQKAIENAEAAGLSLSEVINAFLVKFATEGVAPFRIGAPETPNAAAAAAMKGADEGRATRREPIAGMRAKAGIEKPSAHAQSWHTRSQAATLALARLGTHLELFWQAGGKQSLLSCASCLRRPSAVGCRLAAVGWIPQ